MMVAAVDRIARHVAQRVVHEAHVPLEAEAEAALVHRLRHLGPGGRFLGDRHRAGMGAVDRDVHRLEEADRLQILAAAARIGQPLARLARIIEVQHRGDRIDAQPVEVIFLGPVERVVDEEGQHLAPPEIVDRGLPVGVEALARIGMLVERRPVEMLEPEGIGREMGRHPIEDHADPDPVRAVDEARKALPVAIARGRRIEAGGLVAPARIVGIFADRQQLDMGEAHIDDIRQELFGQRIPIEEATVRATPPRSGMDLVDRDRLAAHVGIAPEGAMGVVAPFVDERRGDDRGRRRSQLGLEGERIGLERDRLAGRADDLELVRFSRADAGNEDLPDAGIAAVPHHVAPAVPRVEPADHRHAPCIGRPDGEMRAVGALMMDRMRAELVEQPQMRSLGDIIIVHRSQDRTVGIGIVDPPVAAGIAGMIAQRPGLADAELAFEYAPGTDRRERADRLAVESEGLDHLGVGDEAARNEPAALPMDAQHCERIAMCRRNDSLGLAGIHGRLPSALQTPAFRPCPLILRRD